MSATAVVVLGLAGVLGVGTLVVTAVYLTRARLSRSGGWANLAAVYSTGGEPTGLRFERQTIMVDTTQFKHCVTMVAGDSGLYVSARIGWVRLPALLMPWADIHPVAETKLYWRAAERLDVGSPAHATMIVFVELYQRLKPRLRAEAGGPERSAQAHDVSA